MIAPFWGNFSTFLGGEVSWEIHNTTLSSDVIGRVSDFIKDEYGDVKFNGTWMMISFWENVTPAGDSSVVSLT